MEIISTNVKKLTSIIYTREFKLLFVFILLCFHWKYFRNQKVPVRISYQCSRVQNNLIFFLNICIFVKTVVIISWKWFETRYLDLRRLVGTNNFYNLMYYGLRMTFKSKRPYTVEKYYWILQDCTNIIETKQNENKNSCPRLRR